jgi:tetratricopeptide (TPR) repeat protein
VNWKYIPVGIFSVFLLLPVETTAANKTLVAAREAAGHGEWEQAADLAGRVIAEDESNDDAWALLGESQLALGDTGNAISTFEKAVSLEPRQALAVLTLTTYYLKQNKFEEAERVVAAAEKRDEQKKIDEIKVARGLIYANEGKFADATRILVSAAEKNPKNPIYQQILARLYNDVGVKERAEEYYAKAWKLSQRDLQLAYEYALVLMDLQKYNEALELFRQVQEKDPENKTVDYLIGRLYFASHKWGEAAAQFEKAARKRPDHYYTHLLLGRSILEMAKAEKKNYYRQAEISFRKAHNLKPERAEVLPYLGEVLLTQARLFYQRAVAGTDTLPGAVAALCDSTIQLSEEAITFDTTLAGVYSLIARAYNKGGNLDSSICYSRLQLSLTPDDDIELARLVNALQRKKDLPGLIETLRPEFMKLDWTPPSISPDSSTTPTDTVAAKPAVTPQGEFIEKFAAVFTNALMETGASSEAREVLRKMLAYNPYWRDGYSLDAYIDLKKSNYAGAVPILAAGVKACPDDAELWLLLGDCHYFSDPKKKENVKRAKDCYFKAKQLGNAAAAEKYEQLSKF